MYFAPKLDFGLWVKNPKNPKNLNSGEDCRQVNPKNPKNPISGEDCRQVNPKNPKNPISGEDCRQYHFFYREYNSFQ